jgi:hypothetical protein
MFTIDSLDEIYHSMEKQLVSNQLDSKYGFDKLARAADCLNAAAEIFDKAGMHKEAAEVLDILKGIK